MPQISDLWRIARPPMALLIGTSFLLLVETAATLTIPWVGGRFAEQVLAKPEINAYQELLLIWLGLLVVQNGLRFTGNYLLGSSGAAATANLRCRIYDHLQALPLNYHDEQDPGDTMSLLSRDAGILGQFFTGTLPNLLPQILTLLGAWTLIAYMDLTLALLIGITTPVITISLRILLRRIRPLAIKLADAHGQHMAIVEENLRLLNLLKAFSREQSESERVREKNEDILKLERHHLLISSLIGPIVQAIGGILLIFTLWISAQRLLTQALSPGELVSLLLYGLLLFRPAGQLISAAGSLQSTLGASKRLQSLLDSPVETHGHGITSIPDQPGKITFENVSFSYPGQVRLFSDFSLEIKAGETIAITGPNGAGKSTLIQLLMRFRQPQTGHILVGDQDIQGLSLHTLRGLIGLIPQHTALLNSTVRENIRFGTTETSAEAIERAIELAQAREMIDKLPDGMETVLGKDGVRLSGGQRQRIALARALLRGCPILVFDEATSMFDAPSIGKFIWACRRELKDETLIFITHQTDVLKIADRVVEVGS